MDGPSPSTCWPSTSAPRTMTWLWRCTSLTLSSMASRWLTWRTCWRISRYHQPHHPHPGLPKTVLSPHPVCLCLQVYMELEQGKNVDFWRDMTIITEDEISKLRKLEASGKGPGNPGPALTPSWLTRKTPGCALGDTSALWELSWGHICIGGGCHWGWFHWKLTLAVQTSVSLDSTQPSGGLCGSHQGAALSSGSPRSWSTGSPWMKGAPLNDPWAAQASLGAGPEGFCLGFRFSPKTQCKSRTQLCLLGNAMQPQSVQSGVLYILFI